MSILLVCSLLLLGSLSLSFDLKNLAGPPSEFQHHRIPDPSKILQLERSLSKSVWFDREEENVTLSVGDLVYTTTIAVDGASDVALSFASPVAENLLVELRDPDGIVVPLRTVKDYFHVGDSTVDRIPAFAYILKEPKAGYYTFSLYSGSLTPELLRDVLDNPYPDAVIMLVADDDIKIASHLQSYFIRAGSNVGLISTILDDDFPFGLISTHNVIVSSASMEVTNPEGQTTIIPMNDDGLENDVVPGDGYYSGSVNVQLSGTYIIEAKLDGHYISSETLEETPFQRTTQHLVEVSSISDLEISGKGRLSIIDNNRVSLNFRVIGDEKVPRDYQFRAYAEVYAFNSQHQLKPACWIGGLVTLDANHEFELVLDKRWLQKAGDLSLPLTIRNLYISDVTTSYPLTQYHKDIVIDGPAKLALYFKPARKLNITPEIEREMRNGLPPTWLTDNSTRATDINLVLLPGYCAEVNPWTRKAEDFTNGFFPVQYGNYANDEYAKLIVDQIEKQELTRFGIIAHSQGGMVALHIHNFYWTGLEEAEGQRLIQTLGTPYQGTSASGSMANLAKIFGVACGSNSDLSRDGAANWLSGISMDSRKDVFSYSSTYSSGSYFGDYCSIPMNILLDWPNDGITEEEFAPLPGGNYLGNTQKWCHTIDMGYPPQYDDEGRNKLMNSLAAR